MAGLYFRKGRKVKWWGWWRDSAGRRHAKALGVTKDQASRALSVIVARELDVRNRIPSAAKVCPTLAEFGPTYLERHAKPRKRSWQHDEQRLRRHLLPVLGDARLDAIGGREVSQLVAHVRREGLSPATTNRVLALLGKMLQCAIDWGDLDKAVRIEKLRERNDGFRYVEQAGDVGRLVSEVSTKRPALRPILTFLAYTGARRGEALALDWGDVDLTAGVVTIRRGSRDGPTKSGAARTVPLHGDLRILLLDHRMRTGRPETGPVFVTEIGKRFTPDGLRLGEALGDACERLGIQPVTLHHLRHTFGAHFAMAGGDLATLREILGHSGLSVTQRYVHLAPEHAARQVAKVSFEADRDAITRATSGVGGGPRKRG